MPLKLDHLTMADHERLAEILTRVQDELSKLVPIVSRAGWSDEVMRSMKRNQERLIDPLRAALDRTDPDNYRRAKSLYPSVYYAIGPGR
jgi:hypothetical protein